MGGGRNSIFGWKWFFIMTYQQVWVSKKSERGPLTPSYLASPFGMYIYSKTPWIDSRWKNYSNRKNKKVLKVTPKSGMTFKGNIFWSGEGVWKVEFFFKRVIIDLLRSFGPYFLLFFKLYSEDQYIKKYNKNHSKSPRFMVVHKMTHLSTQIWIWKQIWVLKWITLHTSV